MSDRPAPPVAKREPKVTEQLGRSRSDDYAWLKDDNWRAVMRDPKAVRADIAEHLAAENAYTKAMLASTEALQAQMFAEMRGRVKEDDSSLPAPDGPWDYYARFDTGAAYPLYCRKPRGEEGPEEVLLDEPKEAEGSAFFSVGAATHSYDHQMFAWAVDAQGSEYFAIKIKDLATGVVTDGPQSSSGDFCFSPDSQWLFWVWRNEESRPAKVFRRPARGGEDVLVYEERDEGFFIHLGVSASRAFIEIGAGDHETSETRLIPASDPTAEPRIVEPRTPGLRYGVEHWPTDDQPSRLVIHTNADGAVDYKLMWADAAGPGRAHWREWIAHQPGRYLVGITATKDFLLRLERVDANNRIVLTARADLSEHAIAFDEEAFALSFETGWEFDSPTVRFVYQSPTTPRSTFDYDMATRERTLRKVQEIPSGHDASRYVARRLHATAKDGASIPVTVLMRADTPLDGSAPLLLYGYGSYGISMEPSFSIRNLSLVDRGWIWAVAHIRGGSEKGWGWFLDGRREKKINTFTDFIACAEHLTEEGYGSRGGIVAYGGSAGGMLMGAVANMAPELFAGIIAAVPFVDVLNTMSDADLPLTPPEWPEWGNPLEDAEAYDRILGYSPYDNVRNQAYPAILATGGLSDPRVTYWEPAKWAAKVRAHTTGAAPVLLKINMEAGHGGASGRFDFLKEIALDYAFAVWAIEKGWAESRGVILRSATPADAPALAEIYADAVLHGFGTFEETPPPPEEMEARRAKVAAYGLPYLLAEIDGRAAGFAYAAPFRPRAAYRFTVEDSVYIHPAFRGRGVGKALLAAVIEACEALGVRQVTALIGDSGNLGSIRLHESCGLERAGLLPGVGYKHGRWLDVVWMRRDLNGGAACDPDAPGLVLEEPR